MSHATDSQILSDLAAAEEMIIEFAHVDERGANVVIPPWVADPLDDYRNV